MAANQKALNQIGIFWYQFTPRKLLYLMILVNLVNFGPNWLSVFFGHPVYFQIGKSKDRLEVSFNNKFLNNKRNQSQSNEILSHDFLRRMIFPRILVSKA